MTTNYTGVFSLFSTAEEVFRAGTVLIYSLLTSSSIFYYNEDMTFSIPHGMQPVTTKPTGIRNASGIVNILLEAKYSSCEQCTEHLTQFFSNSAFPSHAVYNRI